VGLEQIRRESGHIVAANARKVFITHGHAEDVLRRVEDFVRALALEPLVVKREASQGQALDDLVEKRMEECQAQIVLATGDDEVDGSWQPRMNVIHEVGLGQRIFKDHIIYLKEDKCEFPSNIAPKVWEPFSRDNLESAFQKIVKELRAFGLLQTPAAARDESG
jgi:predicted nucleotide-binding protein